MIREENKGNIYGLNNSFKTASVENKIYKPLYCLNCVFCLIVIKLIEKTF